MDHRYLYIDTETYPIKRPHLAPKPVCVQWAIDDGPVNVSLYRDAPIREWLADATLTWVGAYLAFDLSVLLYAGHTEVVDLAYTGRLRDVILDARLQAITDGRDLDSFPRSLAGLAAMRGVTMEKNDWRLRYSELDGVPVEYWPHGALTYAKGDIEQTRIEHHLRMAEPVGSRLAASTQLALTLASCQGVHTDPARTEALIAKVGEKLRKDQRLLHRIGLLRRNKDGSYTRDDMAAAKRMYAVMGDSAKLSDKGDEVVASGELTPAEARTAVRRGRRLLRLDADACAASGDRALVRRAEYVSGASLMDRALTMRLGHDLPLQTSFDFPKDTFRTSSRIPTVADIVGCQMQNLLRDLGLREVFTPSPGNTFISCDVALAELHSLSEVTHALFGHSSMGRLLNEDKDLHYAFAAVVQGCTYEDIVSRKDKKARNAAKAYNFGLPGGLGVDTFRAHAAKGYGLFIDRPTAERQIALWFRTFPEVKRYLQWISRQAPRGGGNFTLTHPITGFVRGGCTYTSAANFCFQHLTAWAMAQVLVEITKRSFDPTSALYGYRLWNHVHDEPLLEGPISGAPRAARELADVCQTVFNASVPNFPTTCDPVVSSVWSKRAVSEIGPDGLPRPWNPKV